MKLLILLLLMSCGLIPKQTRKEKILNCVDRFIDRGENTKSVFKECGNIYRTRE